MTRCSGAASVPIAADAPFRFPAYPVSRTCTTWRPTTAACARPPTTARPGFRSSTHSRRNRWAQSPSLLRIRTSSTLPAAKDCSDRIFPSETAFTDPTMAVSRGRTSACAMPCRSTRSSWIRIIPNASSSLRLGIRMVRIRSAACSARPTADSHSRRCSTRTKIPARRRWSSIRMTRTSSMRICGRRGARRGRSAIRTTVRAANTSTYRSSDGGAHFTAIKGAPGGDDYHTVWINPENPQVIALAVDQGATISVNGGETWSTWYNQPTAQFYHVITDNRFPYWVYGAQQESGSAAVVSRGDWGRITARDWQTVGVEEYGYVAPDPLNPDIVFGGKVEKFDRRTGQVQDVGPAAARGGAYRFVRTAPLIFSPVDPKALYLGSNVLFMTTTGGHAWEVISPDLSRSAPEVPASIGVYRTPEMAKMPRRGVIYTVAPSYKEADTIW